MVSNGSPSRFWSFKHVLNASDLRKNVLKNGTQKGFAMLDVQPFRCGNSRCRCGNLGKSRDLELGSRSGVIIPACVYIYNYMKYSCTYSLICTSSTAQGGGGSFKNRKPIGEVGCCESGMAERSH